ncbi:hypothetical protein E2K93_02860 [Thalassotalea sp. HSM 43]|uniref:FG-GAP-like repeat-containing protein n=1 Tax=Thalassotalea sp. HSM 43 TaxID=2552945 RepID=UPI001081E104|nr:FG-GAP-like repeat-containing protein [Thalassotalea sp. HSM 43]QBY03376.1 hypothetical protein E2K93_02860 [Thalassotalea sp. HSM 43]
MKIKNCPSKPAVYRVKSVVSTALLSLTLSTTLVSCGGSNKGSSNSQADKEAVLAFDQSSTPAKQVNELEAYTYTPKLNIDTSQLSFSLSNQPSWLSLDEQTGQLMGTPSQTDAGTYNDITLTVQYQGQTITQHFDIAVYDRLTISGSLAGFEHLDITSLSVFIDRNGNGLADENEVASELQHGEFEFQLSAPSLADLSYIQPVLLFSGNEQNYLDTPIFAHLAGTIASLPVAIENSDNDLTNLSITPVHALLAEHSRSYWQKLHMSALNINDFQQQLASISQHWSHQYGLPLTVLGDDFNAHYANLSAQQKVTVERLSRHYFTEQLLLQSTIIDTDDDGQVNRIDDDVDNDGFVNVIDQFPTNLNEHHDNDVDGLGDYEDNDDDNDQILDQDDAFPFDASEYQDNDADRIGDNKDQDDDNDGIADLQDHFPLDASEHMDSDLDGIGNNADEDDDNDGVNDADDAYPLDNTKWQNNDADEDGWPLGQDPDDTDNRVPDIAFNDFDFDGFADSGGLLPDNDDDNDGVLDIDDAFPFDKTEFLDSDADGIGNNQDIDDDNDLVIDIDDAFPLDATESKDNDDDGVGDNADNDDDNDGIPDDEDDIDDINFDADVLNSGLIFADSSNLLGLTHRWQLDDVSPANATQNVAYNVAGGLASGDYDQDGDIDIYVVGGNSQASKLYQQQNDGSYIDIAAQAGVQLNGLYSGPAFADTDGDGDLDLFVAAMPGFENVLFINDGNGKFSDSNSAIAANNAFNISTSFGDFDADGKLDMLLTHYGESLASEPQLLWQNKGDNRFVAIDDSSKLTSIATTHQRDTQNEDYMFTASFADINQDGLQDILVASDHSTSMSMLSQEDGTLSDSSDELNIRIDDLQGMGSSLADIDNDGDLDWFVTSITQFDGTSGSLSFSGNKLLKNNGDGSFVDVSYASNTFNGGWGWASCAADFNNDGWIDLFNVNGWLINSDAASHYESHLNDTVALFLNNKDGNFSRTNINVGLSHQGQGRAVLCSDFDNDGDVDILLTDHTVGKNALLYYENQNGNQLGNYLTVRLSATEHNSQGIGAIVEVHTRNNKQYRHINLNSNFTSQAPALAMFGVGQHKQIERIQVTWPDGDIQTVENIAVNQSILIKKTDNTL